MRFLKLLLAVTLVIYSDSPVSAQGDCQEDCITLVNRILQAGAERDETNWQTESARTRFLAAVLRTNLKEASSQAADVIARVTSIAVRDLGSQFMKNVEARAMANVEAIQPLAEGIAERVVNTVSSIAAQDVIKRVLKKIEECGAESSMIACISEYPKYSPDGASAPEALREAVEQQNWPTTSHLLAAMTLADLDRLMLDYLRSVIKVVTAAADAEVQHPLVEEIEDTLTEEVVRSAISQALMDIFTSTAVCAARVQETPSDDTVSECLRMRPSREEASSGEGAEQMWSAGRSPKSFPEAKKFLASIHKDITHLTTLYCRCPYVQRDSSGDIDRESCGLKVRENEKRSDRIEWEHVVPAAWIGETRICWTQGHPSCVRKDGEAYKGRDCCLKKGVDPRFAAAHNDPHNLFPASGEVNRDRWAHPFGTVDKEPREYGECDFEVGGTPKVAEPALLVRGELARAMLYMSEKYGLDVRMGRDDLIEWHETDPPESWEIERAKRIEKETGLNNPYIRATEPPKSVSPSTLPVSSDKSQ